MKDKKARKKKTKKRGFLDAKKEIPDIKIIATKQNRVKKPASKAAQPQRKPIVPLSPEQPRSPQGKRGSTSPIVPLDIDAAIARGDYA